jgi:hypothetical protein
MNNDNLPIEEEKLIQMPIREFEDTKMSELSTNRDLENQIWENDIENILEKIRKNSIILSHHHKKYYNHLKDKLKYFRIPIIILGSINTVLSISLEDYTIWASVIICTINLLLTIISSIELFLGIQNQIEKNLILQRDFYILSIDIYKTLQLNRKNRKSRGIEYLDKCFDEYNKLFQLSTLQHIKDSLTPLEKEYQENESPDSSTIHNETNI